MKAIPTNFYPTRGTFVAVLLLFGQRAWSANTTWTGNADLDWQNAANWSNGVPADNDFGSDAFIGSGTPGTITNIPYQDIRSVNFTTAGWTLDGSFNMFKDLGSSGAGTNTITGNLNEQVGGATYTIDAGNTLYLGGYLRIYDEDVNITGGGMFSVDNLRSSDFGTPEIRLDEITFRVRGTKPFGNSSHQGEIHLLGQNAVLELQTSDVAAVEALYGQSKGGIFDDLGGTGNLQATYNSVSGFTEVTVIPEMSTGILLLGSLCLLIGLRRKQ